LLQCSSLHRCCSFRVYLSRSAEAFSPPFVLCLHLCLICLPFCFAAGRRGGAELSCAGLCSPWRLSPSPRMPSSGRKVVLKPILFLFLLIAACVCLLLFFCLRIRVFFGSCVDSFLTVSVLHRFS